MAGFKYYENEGGWTESAFRSRYGDWVQEGSMQCCYGMEGDDQCKNDCHFLMAGGIENVDCEGFFPVFGIDCDVDVLCWGGDDVENSTIETYCKDCAHGMHEARLERESKEQLDREQFLEAKRVKQAEEKRKGRSLLAYWDKLSPIAFEEECAQLFRDLGFKAKNHSNYK